MAKNILWFDELGVGDVAEVGGKNASLGEMIQKLSSAGLRVPGGFATTADAYRDFLQENKLTEKIFKLLEKLDVDNIVQLAKVGAQIRGWIEEAKFAEEFISDIKKSHETLMAEHKDAAFAVRSSATAEDLPDASFAGQQETFLNVRGFDNVLLAIKKVFCFSF